MPLTDARRHRSAVARVVHMAQDRPDLDGVACTLTKTMAHFRIGDEWLVKRVCRYIKGRPRCAQSYEYQSRLRSWWCRQTVIGHRASPLADLIQEASQDWRRCGIHKKCHQSTILCDQIRYRVGKTRHRKFALRRHAPS